MVYLCMNRFVLFLWLKCHWALNCFSSTPFCEIALCRSACICAVWHQILHSWTTSRLKNWVSGVKITLNMLASRLSVLRRNLMTSAIRMDDPGGVPGAVSFFFINWYLALFLFNYVGLFSTGSLVIRHRLHSILTKIRIVSHLSIVV